MELPEGSIELGEPGTACLVFVPGFLCPPSAYRSLLEPVADHLGHVVALSVAGSTLATVTGRSTPAAEAARTVEVVARLRDEGREVWLGGHSRGGLVSWLSAPRAAVRGLVLVDPVGGGGPPWAAPDPLPPLGTAAPVLVVGCGRGGRCAPADRNHDTFAAAAPGCRHLVVPDAGHADVVDGSIGRIGRFACGSGGHHRAAAHEIAAAIVGFLDDHRGPGTPSTT